RRRTGPGSLPVPPGDRAARGTDRVRVGGRSGQRLHLHAAGGAVSAVAPRAKRILLVEDDRFLRRACEASLRQSGFTVVSAADGVAGLRAAGEASPDLILLDVLLPGMSGLEVLRHAKADPMTRDIPVL